MDFFSFFNQAFTVEIQIFFVSFFALIFGSFASLISHRAFTKEAIVFGRSKCLFCGTKLKIKNLVPLFSWIFQKGKCSNCFAKISLRYPLIELSFLVSFLVIFFALKQEMSWKMIIYFGIASNLIVMCIFDLERYFIPDLSQYFLTILATLLLLNQGGSYLVLENVKSGFAYLAFSLALFCFFYFVARIEAIGVDDIKFFFVAGFLLGLESFLAFTMLNGFLGILFGLIWQKITKQNIFPFAPAICASTFLCLIFDKKIDPVALLGNLIF